MLDKESVDDLQYELDLFLPVIPEDNTLPFGKYILQVSEYANATKLWDYLKVTILWPQTYFGRSIKVKTKEWNRIDSNLWGIIIPASENYSYVNEKGRVRTQVKTNYTAIEIEHITDADSLGKLIFGYGKKFTNKTAEQVVDNTNQVVVE